MKQPTRFELQDKRKALAEAEAELTNIYYMSEEEACQAYNVNYKDDIIELMQEKIDEVKSEIATLEESLEAEADAERSMYHFAFPSERNFWDWKY